MAAFRGVVEGDHPAFGAVWAEVEHHALAAVWVGNKTADGELRTDKGGRKVTIGIGCKHIRGAGRYDNSIFYPSTEMIALIGRRKLLPRYQQDRNRRQ